MRLVYHVVRCLGGRVYTFIDWPRVNISQKFTGYTIEKACTLSVYLNTPPFIGVKFSYSEVVLSSSVSKTLIRCFQLNIASCY